MADHLVSATLIQKVLYTALGDREVCLAVDQDAARVFDLDDATKVQIEHGMVECIGKHLSVWNAIDTGIFLATPALFGALAGAAAQGRYALSHGIEELAEAGQVHAVDVTGQPWLDVDTPDSFQEAHRRLLGSLGKNGADGFISTHVNRRLSVPLSALLVRTPVTTDPDFAGQFLHRAGGSGILHRRSALGQHRCGVSSAALVRERRVRWRSGPPPTPSNIARRLG